MQASEGRTLHRLPEAHARRYVSIFGAFRLERTVYGSREGQALQFVPLDNRLQLPAGAFSYLLQDWDQALAVEQAFGQVNQTIARLRIADETLLFSNPRRRCLARISVECDAHPHRFDGRFRVAWTLISRISLAIAACAGLCPFCRFRMHRRPEWPLVSTRERGFPTIGQLPHSAAFL